MGESLLIRKSPVVIIKSLFFWECAAMVAYFAAAVAANYGELYKTFPFSHTISYVIAKFIFIALVELALVSFVFLRWLYTIYIIQPASIVIQNGVVVKKRETFALRLPPVLSCEYGPLSQLFGHGTLVIGVRGQEKPVKLPYVSNPKFYLSLIRETAMNAAADANHPTDENLDELLAGRERENLEFKSSLRWDRKENRVNRDLENAVMKTAAAFLNSGGGHLIIGIDNTGTPAGLGADYATLRRPDADAFENHFTNVFKESIGPQFRPFVKISFPVIKNTEVCHVRVSSAPEPAFMKNGEAETFYIRTGNSTTALPISKAADYIHSRWKKSGS